ncbi:MAG: hypothetical protein HOO67_06870 [Candidatus Peribacteraceae bacterium]|nr:hypothetical protein [Candidatus Peribacteraceae bacterium]
MQRIEIPLISSDQPAESPDVSPAMRAVLGQPLKNIIADYGRCTVEQSRIAYKHFTLDMTVGDFLQKLDAIKNIICRYAHDKDVGTGLNYPARECLYHNDNGDCGHQGLRSMNEYRKGDGTSIVGTGTEDNAAARCEYAFFFLEAMGKGPYTRQKEIVRATVRRLNETDDRVVNGTISDEESAGVQRENGPAIVAIAQELAADIRAMAKEIAAGTRQKTLAGIPNASKKGVAFDVSLLLQ